MRHLFYLYIFSTKTFSVFAKNVAIFQNAYFQFPKRIFSISETHIFTTRENYFKNRETAAPKSHRDLDGVRNFMRGGGWLARRHWVVWPVDSPDWFWSNDRVAGLKFDVLGSLYIFFRPRLHVF